MYAKNRKNLVQMRKLQAGLIMLYFIIIASWINYVICYSNNG